jgi:two-component system, chemotaxis family, chemotaxis protein CheY
MARSEERVGMAKILVIEDDSIVRKTIAHLLEEAGHLVLWAEDGRQGMAVFRSWQPDLVVTDIVMPEQEGIETIIEMRAAEPNAKIIAISGGGRIGNTDFLNIARHLGAMAAVPKPFHPDLLLAIVEDCLSGGARDGGERAA